MRYRIAILAQHNEPRHPRPVEVLDSLQQLVLADPSTFIRVQTLNGDVLYHTPKRTLDGFQTKLIEDGSNA